MNEIRKANDPANAMDSENEVQSNDRKLKQDFPGYPHNPASKDEMKEERNWRTDFSNESDTTATGSESVRDNQRPSLSENDPTAGSSEEQELKRGSDRGLKMHETDPGETGN